MKKSATCFFSRFTVQGSIALALAYEAVAISGAKLQRSLAYWHCPQCKQTLPSFERERFNNLTRLPWTLRTGCEPKRPAIHFGDGSPQTKCEPIQLCFVFLEPGGGGLGHPDPEAEAEAGWNKELCEFKGDATILRATC